MPCGGERGAEGTLCLPDVTGLVDCWVDFTAGGDVQSGVEFDDGVAQYASLDHLWDGVEAVVWYYCSAVNAVGGRSRECGASVGQRRPQRNRENHVVCMW